MRKFEIYLGGDNDNDCARFPQGEVQAIVKEYVSSFTLCPVIGCDGGAIEGSWALVIFSESSRAPTRAAEALANYFRQRSVILYDATSNNAIFVAGSAS